MVVVFLEGQKTIQHLWDEAICNFVYVVAIIECV